MPIKTVQPEQQFPAASGIQTINLSRRGRLQTIFGTLTATVTNGGLNAVGPSSDFIMNLIRYIELQINGNDTPIAIKGAHIATWHSYDYGIQPFGLDVAPVLTAAAATTYTVQFAISMGLAQAMRPEDTALDLLKETVSSATLRVTWGDITDLYATPNGATLSNVSLSISTEHYVYTPAEYAEHIRTSGPALVRRLDYVSGNFAGAGNNIPIQLERGNLAYRRLGMVTQDNTNNKVRVNTVLDAGQVRLAAGSVTYVDQIGQALRAMGQYRRQLIAGTNNSQATGIYMADLAGLPYGSNKTMINVNSVEARDDLYWNNSPAAAGNYDLVREALRQPIGW